MCYCDVRTLQTKSTMYKQCKQNSQNFAKKVLVIKLDPPKDFDKSTRLYVRTHYFEVEMHVTSQSDIYYVLTQVTNISQRNSSELF